MTPDTKDQEQKVPYKNNNFLIEPFGIYNFFRVRMELGETPKELSEQMFTNRTVAEVAINNYVNKNTKAKKDT